MLLLLWSEIPSGMCAKLRTVAASNNRDHPTRSLSSSPLASTINCSPVSQELLEVTHQDHSIGITLLLLVRATYIYFCSSRTSRSWWIMQSTQRHRRGCNITLLRRRRQFLSWPCPGKMRKHCGMVRHQSKGYCKVRSFIHRVKCDYSVQRIGTITNNLAASKHVTMHAEIACVVKFAASFEKQALVFS